LEYAGIVLFIAVIFLYWKKMTTKYRTFILLLFAVFMSIIVMNQFIIPNIRDIEILNTIADVYIGIGSIGIVASIIVIFYPQKKE